MSDTLVMVGTRKGLWIGRSDEARREWSWTGPQFPMEEVYSCMVDTRGDRPRLLAGASSSWLGPQVWRSDDLGETWQETPNGAVRFPEDTDASVARIWQLVPGVDEDVVYAGTEPGAIFRSDDRGESFELERGLWDNPQRKEWNAGFGGQAFHTILPHPEEPAKVLAAISTGGVYRTDDNGEHWESIAEGLPADFGFVMLTHPRREGTAWVVPLKADGERIPPEGKLAVHRTDDAGATWKRLSTGLPEGEYNSVLRDAASVDSADPVGVYFGTRGGAVYASANEGETFTEVASHFPDVLCVRAAMVAGARLPESGVPETAAAQGA